MKDCMRKMVLKLVQPDLCCSSWSSVDAAFHAMPGHQAAPVQGGRQQLKGGMIES